MLSTIQGIQYKSILHAQPLEGRTLSAIVDTSDMTGVGTLVYEMGCEMSTSSASSDNSASSASSDLSETSVSSMTVSSASTDLSESSASSSDSLSLTSVSSASSNNSASSATSVSSASTDESDSSSSGLMQATYEASATLTGEYTAVPQTVLPTLKLHEEGTTAQQVKLQTLPGRFLKITINPAGMDDGYISVSIVAH